MRVELHPLAVEALRQLERDLRAEGWRERPSNIVNALIYNARPVETVGQCRRFNRDSYAHDHPERGGT